MKYYYALFKKTSKVIEVEFPDLPGCVTFADTWDEAISMATDVLAGWMANSESRFHKDPSKFEELKHLKGTLVPIVLKEEIMRSYQEVKRFNVIFPLQVLRSVDSFRKSKGIKRSTFLVKAAEEYLKRHASI